MRTEYDFSNSVKNPYTKNINQEVTITLDMEIIKYFQTLEQETGISYVNLINLYLSDCVKSQRKPIINWVDYAQNSNYNYGEVPVSNSLD